MRRLLQGRYVFTFLAFLTNMMNLLGRDTLRLAILPMKEHVEHSHWSRSIEILSFCAFQCVVMAICFHAEKGPILSHKRAVLYSACRPS